MCDECHANPRANRFAGGIDSALGRFKAAAYGGRKTKGGHVVEFLALSGGTGESNVVLVLGALPPFFCLCIRNWKYRLK